jgi:hypothetical protein
MITIVAGGRDFNNYPIVASILDKYQISMILSGAANGADSCGETYGKRKDIPVWQFPANWDLYHNKAGFIRNKKMAKEAQRLIAFWDGKSPGTKSMLFLAKQFNLEVHCYDYNGEPRLPR